MNAAHRAAVKEVTPAYFDVPYCHEKGQHRPIRKALLLLSSKCSSPDSGSISFKFYDLNYIIRSLTYMSVLTTSPNS